MDKLRTTSSLHTGDVVECLDNSGIETVFTSICLRRTLFPEDRLVSAWVPMRIMKENIDDIMGCGGFILGSNIDGDGSKALFSIGHSYSSDLGRLLVIFVYGTDTEYLKYHLARHLNEICARFYERNLICSVFSETEMKRNVQTVMLELGLRYHGWKDKSAAHSKLYCTEYEVWNVNNMI